MAEDACLVMQAVYKVVEDVKKYNFTAADGGNSNKMRNFVS